MSCVDNTGGERDPAVGGGVDDYNLFFQLTHFSTLFTLPFVILFVIFPKIYNLIIFILFDQTSTWYEFLSYNYFLHFINLLHPAIFMIITNGLTYGIYNLSSTLLLSRISILEHAAYNCGRRLFAVIFTSVFFGNFGGGPAKILGGVMTILGFGGFSYLKGKRKEKGLKIRKEEQVLYQREIDV